MTRQSIDRAIAEKIFGHTVIRCGRGYEISDRGYDPEDMPRYSSDLGLSMTVFDHMRQHGHRWLINADDAGYHLRRVALVVRDLERDEVKYVADRPLGWAKKLEQLPMVICKAALKEINLKD